MPGARAVPGLPAGTIDLMKVLGIETSCDETAAAVYDGEARSARRIACTARSSMHAEYGGVVPELASRDHVRKLLPLIEAALADAAADPTRSTGWPIPPARGWSGALLVGRCGRPKPRIGVGSACCRRTSPRGPPAGADARSRGARRSRSWRCWYRVDTRCSPMCAAWATTGSSAPRSTMPPARPSTRPPSCSGCRIRAGRRWHSSRSTGAPVAIAFPRPMLDRPGLDFSFSGLKTAVVVATRGAELDEQDARRRRLRVSAGGRRNAGREVRARHRRRRDCRRWSWPAAWVRIEHLRQQLDALGRAPGSEDPLSAAGVLHGQRGDDRVRWLSPSQRGRTRRPRDPRDGALAARHPASAAAHDLNAH